MMENIVYLKRRDEEHDQGLYDEYGLPETWIQKSSIVVVYNTSDSAFSVTVDTRTGNHGSTGVDPIGRASLGPLSKKIVKEISRRLNALEEVDRKQLTDEEFVIMVQEAHDFIADMPRVII